MERSQSMQSFQNWKEMVSSTVQIVLDLPYYIWWKRPMVPSDLDFCFVFPDDLELASKL